ncbi:family 43 glycosylhydrolase [Subtercola endophyticus]|uniref:family 43 glycosylhydrolase n=1 Tax=Subtercola endophyticus TaxID=2895559 RepID=UPI001E3C1C18|nr:family 43 glycosylhydrolase [Subtercola endophyticus]UFS59940.1 family 43 glycosylhydrolase [Subtercola endophyticus]
MIADGLGAPTSDEQPSALRGYYADPHLMAFDGRYYLYPTSDGVEGWEATTFRVFSSPDLVDWSDHGVIIDLASDVAWADHRAWAPAIAERSGRYYFYFTAENNIGVAVSDSPTGPFTDLGHPLVADGDFEGTAIDPSVFTDDDGTVYLFWGNSVAHGVRLSDDMQSFDPAAVFSWKPTNFREAAWVHRRGEVYYLSWSENDTREEDYRVRYATGPTAFGPWSDRGTLVAKVPQRGIRATGHHSILRVPGTDDWVIAYHRFAIPHGDGFHREVVIDRLVHRADGTIEPVVPTREPLRIPIPPRS